MALKITLKIWSNAEILGTKDMSNAENVQCDLKFFSVITVSLSNKGKYLTVIINVISFVFFSVISVCFQCETNILV